MNKCARKKPAKYHRNKIYYKHQYLPLSIDTWKFFNLILKCLSYWHLKVVKWFCMIWENEALLSLPRSRRFLFSYAMYYPINQFIFSSDWLIRENFSDIHWILFSALSDVITYSFLWLFHIYQDRYGFVPQSGGIPSELLGLQFHCKDIFTCTALKRGPSLKDYCSEYLNTCLPVDFGFPCPDNQVKIAENYFYVINC